MNGEGAHLSAIRLLVGVSLKQSWRRLLAVRHQSRLLSTLVLGFLLGYAVLSFYLFHRGLRFASSFPGLGPVLVERMLFLLFAFLFSLLLMSNLVIGYTNLFRNRETSFLHTLPVGPGTILQWKFIETTVLASWAFLFLIAPLLAAYGLTQQVPWHFYPATVVLLALFLVLPSVGGVWLAVLLARFLDRRRFQVALISVAVLGVAAVAMYMRPEVIPDEEMETRVLVVLDKMLMRTRFALFPLLPSYWLASGVQHWAEGAVRAAAFFGFVLLSHALFFGSCLCLWLGEPFFSAFSAVQGRGSVLARWGWFQAWEERQRSGARRLGLVEWVFGRLSWFGSDVRAMLIKDVRVFWRDTTQWGQTILLFGLLGVYIVNLRHFTQQLTNPFWIYIVSYLNLGACALNLATLTTRFVYPQFSLEGKRVWIVGLAPLGLPRILLSKYVLSTGCTLAITLGLMLLSCRMLRLELGRTLYLAAAVGVMTFVLNALAVGLGALYPNFKEDNPSKIVSGFGGTFCLVLSFVYIVGSVIVLALGSPWAGRGEPSVARMAGAWVGFAALSLLAGWVPLKLGLRRAQEFEY